MKEAKVLIKDIAKFYLAKDSYSLIGSLKRLQPILAQQYNKVYPLIDRATNDIIVKYHVPYNIEQSIWQLAYFYKRAELVYINGHWSSTFAINFTVKDVVHIPSNIPEDKMYLITQMFKSAGFALADEIDQIIITSAFVYLYYK